MAGGSRSLVGLAGDPVSFVAVGFVCGPVRSAMVSFHVWDVAAGEWLELLVMVSSSLSPVTVGSRLPIHSVTVATMPFPQMR